MKGIIEEIKSQIGICTAQATTEKFAGNQIKESFWRGKCAGFGAALQIINRPPNQEVTTSAKEEYV